MYYKFRFTYLIYKCRYEGCCARIFFDLLSGNPRMALKKSKKMVKLVFARLDAGFALFGETRPGPTTDSRGWNTVTPSLMTSSPSLPLCTMYIVHTYV